MRAGQASELLDYQSNVSPRAHYYNYNLMFSKWADAFGPSNVEAVLYDRSGFLEGDIRKDFIRRLLPDINFNALRYDDIGASNEKFSLLQARAANAVNSNTDRRLGLGEAGNRGHYLFNAVVSSEALQQGELFDPRQPEMFNAFKDSNRKFFAKFLPGSREFSRPEKKGDPNEGVLLSIYQVGDIISRLIGDITKRISNRLLLDQDADLLRDTALKYESGGSISKSEAIALMRLAHHARPNGAMIRKKIEEWERTPDVSDDAGVGA